MKIQVRPCSGKVVVSAACIGTCGFHDVLRPCPVCGLPVRRREMSPAFSAMLLAALVAVNAPPPSVKP